MESVKEEGCGEVLGSLFGDDAELQADLARTGRLLEQAAAIREVRAAIKVRVREAAWLEVRGG